MMINLRTRQWIVLPILVPLLILAFGFTLMAQIVAIPAGFILDWMDKEDVPKNS